MPFVNLPLVFVWLKVPLTEDAEGKGDAFPSFHFLMFSVKAWQRDSQLPQGGVSTAIRLDFRDLRFGDFFSCFEIKMVLINVKLSYVKSPPLPGLKP